MALRWRKIGRLQEGEEKKERGSTLRYDAKWQSKMVINGFGSVCTAIVMMVFAVTKFKDGAFVVLIVIPLLVGFFLAVHSHYRSLARSLSLDDYGEPLRVGRHRVIVPVSGVHRGSLAALHYAQALSDDVTVLHVSIDPEETDKVREKWERWGNGIRLVVLESPYRLFLEPLLKYIEEIADTRQPGEIITIVVPQFVPKHWYYNFLHMNTAWLLRWALLLKRNIVVTDVPYQVE